MSEIKDFVFNEPLFETHTHQNVFKAHNWKEKNYEEFIQYGTADIATATGKSFEEIVKEGRLFDIWNFIRTTGYGQATEYAVKVLLGLDYTKENASLITKKFKK